MQHARFLTPALCKSLQDFCKGQKRSRPRHARVARLSEGFYLMRVREEKAEGFFMCKV